MSNEIRFSIFRNARDTVPQLKVMSWDLFAGTLGPHNFTYPDKTSCPMFCPAEFRPGATNRRKENLVFVWFGVLDLDGISSAQLLEICKKLDGLDAVLYTTWGHPAVAAKDLWKIRVCARFTRPVDPGEWPLVWRGLNGYFGGLNDPQCKDPGHCYFGAFAPPGTPKELCEVICYKGEALDPSALMTADFTVSPGAQQVPRERLQLIAQRWKRSHNPYRAQMGATLSSAIKGEAFAEVGQRDTTLFQLCSDLAREFPEASADSIAELFAPSLHLMGADAPTIEEVRDKFERQRVAAIVESELPKVNARQAQKDRIRQCFAHLDSSRESPYSIPELGEMRTKLHCTEAQLRNLWMIQVGPQFYLLGPEAVYRGPYTKDDIQTAVLTELAPAETAQVLLWTETDKGPVRKSVPELLAQYGSVADRYVLDLAAQQGSYDPISRTFTVAPCPLRQMEPKHDQAVAEWLESFTGSAHDDVLNWLAHVTDLTIPCAALMMTGPPDTGKSLFAYGVSRLWTKNGPTKASTALSDFNAPITSCPLVFADEKLPTDHRGHGRTSELREFIADRERPYRQKYAPEGSILGCIRFVGAANNENIMAINEHLSLNDIAAIAQRFYHFFVEKKAADYLRTVDTQRFVEGDAIARHVLWLRDNYPKRREGRFILRPRNPEFYSGLSTQSGYRSYFLQWCIGYLKAPSKIDGRMNYHIRIKNGGLWVRTEQVLETWDTYVSNTPAPPTRALAQVIVEMSNERGRHPTPKGERPNYYRIDSTHLYAWAEATDYLTREEINEALAKETESRLATSRPIGGTE